MTHIDEDKIGKECADAIERALKIRAERKTIYGDSYLQDTPEFLIMQIENKIKRLKLHINNSTVNNNIEKAEDNALDMINYSAFLAAVLHKGDKQ